MVYVCMVLLTVGVFSGGVVNTSLLPRLWSHSSAGLLWYEFVVQQAGWNESHGTHPCGCEHNNTNKTTERQRKAIL